MRDALCLVHGPVILLWLRYCRCLETIRFGFSLLPQWGVWTSICVFSCRTRSLPSLCALLLFFFLLLLFAHLHHAGLFLFFLSHSLWLFPNASLSILESVILVHAVFWFVFVSSSCFRSSDFYVFSFAFMLRVSVLSGFLLFSFIFVHASECFHSRDGNTFLL